MIPDSESALAQIRPTPNAFIRPTYGFDLWHLGGPLPFAQSGPQASHSNAACQPCHVCPNLGHSCFFILAQIRPTTETFIWPTYHFDLWHVGGSLLFVRFVPKASRSNADTTLRSRLLRVSFI